MKKLFKNSFMALAVLALGFSSCTEECDYTPAQPSAVETNDFYFNADQPASEIIGLTDTEYTVTIERVNADEELTFDINSVANDEIFDIPATVTFAAGENTADIVIGLSEKMEPFKNYKFELSIPEELINPYKVDNNSVCVVSLMKEDYVPYAKPYILSHERLPVRNHGRSLLPGLSYDASSTPATDPSSIRCAKLHFFPNIQKP